MKCPNCNKHVNGSFKFCPYCATPIVANKCPHCGSSNLPADSKFCPDCGRKIENESLDSNLSFIVRSVLFKMIHVDGGTFTMGEGSDAHQVTLTPYYIGETPVTQELWEAVMGSNPSFFKGDNRPVEEVSWYDCQDFIEKLNAKTGKKFRLLTEAEWEFAARGGKKSKGYEYAGSNLLSEVAGYKGNISIGITPVKQNKPNELGIYDMSGNVWEWCQDWYAIYEKDSQTNPTGPSSGSERVCRGGCWISSAGDCRVSYRNKYKPVYRASSLGFRLALYKPSENEIVGLTPKIDSKNPRREQIEQEMNYVELIKEPLRQIMEAVNQFSRKMMENNEGLEKDKKQENDSNDRYEWSPEYRIHDANAEHNAEQLKRIKEYIERSEKDKKFTKV